MAFLNYLICYTTLDSMGALTFPIFNSIFPGEDIPSVEELINDCSSSRLLRSVAFLNATIHKQQDNLAEQEIIFERWISAFESDLQITIYQNYSKFKFEITRSGGSVILFNSMPLLKLMENIVKNYNDISELGVDNAVAEMTLFKAWLVTNEHFRFEVPENAQPNTDNLFKAILVNKSIQYEFMRSKLFHFQILMGASFFKYLSDHTELSIYLQKFLQAKSVQSFTEYLFILTDVYMNQFSQGGFGFGLKDDSIALEVFFKSMSFAYHDKDDLRTAHNLVQSTDFKLFRQRPLVQREDNTFYLVHYNFFVDKLYQGLVFDFYSQSGIDVKFKTVPSFLQFLGQDFAEKHLFYQFLPQCFPEKYSVKVPGDKFGEIEYSDYYVRDSQTLFLFEFKNVIMGAATKQSKSFSRIKDGIIEKFIRSEDGQAKGVTQLLQTIERLVVSPFHFDDFVAKGVGKLKVVPVIVYCDDFFEVDGVQAILSEEFTKQVGKSRILSSSHHKILDVSLVHLHDIIDISCEAPFRKHLFRDSILDVIKRRVKRLRKKHHYGWNLLLKYRSDRLSKNVRSREGKERLRQLLMNALSVNSEPADKSQVATNNRI